MSKVDRFSVNPTVTISRSKFVRPSQHKTSFKLGEIIPIYFDEVLPDDTRRIDFASLIRMSNPIAPVMDNIYIDYYAFFVPARLTWSHWKEFMGENSSSAGIYEGTEYVIPQIAISGASAIQSGEIGDYFGLPVGVSGNTVPLKVSVLPMRGYRLIYNRWFRDQNLIAPVPVALGDTASSSDDYGVAPFKAAKVSDYFTRALPFAQKGAPVTIPIGTTAPIMGVKSDGTLTKNLILSGVEDLQYEETLGFGDVVTENSDGTIRYEMVDAGNQENVTTTGLVADLASATATTINQLRFAFQYQKMLEKDAMYGTRYWEILHAHFGVIAPDASLQDPEMLGHHRTYINIQQVIQTTGIDQATPAQNELGQVAGNSVTGDKTNILTKSFTEHGFIYILAVARHDQTYGQGVNRMWSRSTRTDYYWPVFANLGSQKVLNKEIYAKATSDDGNIFGYQEAWSEYRYKPSIVSGLLNPSVANSLGFWTLANNFGSLPTLSKSFIEQNRDNLARSLSTGNNGPDFIADFAFQDTAVRALPMYSVPGLIDHH